MAWQFILSDLSGTVIGEVTQAASRKVSLPHMQVATASFVVPTWDTYADTVMNTDTLLKCYRIDPVTLVKTLVFHGPVISAEESAEDSSRTIAVNAADPMWRLSKRLIPGSLLRSSVAYGTAGSPVDIGLIAHNILDDVNATSFTGVSKGTRTNTITGAYLSPPIKNAAEAIAELHAGLNAFEFKLNFTEPTNVGGTDGWPQLATLDVVPMVGVTQSDAVFEYGVTRGNIASYNRQITRDTILNRAITSPSGWPDGTTDVLSDRQNGASITARGRFEEQTPDNGVTDIGLRNAIGDFHVLIRKDPKQTITFRPVINATPSPIVHYNVGDTVRARAVLGSTVRFDALFRVWGISFDIDSNGNEAVDLSLVAT